MTEHQADKIIELLESINSKLSSIESNTGYNTYIDSNTSNIDEILKLLKKISNK